MTLRAFGIFVIVSLGLFFGVKLIQGAPAWLWSRTSPVASRQVDQGYFYRFKASYTVKATGENLDIDAVIPCQAVITTYKGGGSSYDSFIPGDRTNRPDPNILYKITREGHVLLVGAPGACHNRGTTANGVVPKNLLPKAFWFDDADLRYGWMYASEDAYDSPRATIVFHGATVETATAEDYADYLNDLAEHFTPVGSIQHSFGFTFGQTRRSANTRPDGYSYIPDQCYGVEKHAAALATMVKAMQEFGEIDAAATPARFIDPAIAGLAARVR